MNLGNAFRANALQFLRINSQQHQYERAPRMLLILAQTLVIFSTVATLAVALVGAFVKESVYPGGLFILCVCRDISFCQNKLAYDRSHFCVRNLAPSCGFGVWD